MNFLFLFISLIFSFIFFVFYKLSIGASVFSVIGGDSYVFSSVFGSIFIDSIVFLCIGLFLFFYFSSFKILKQSVLREGDQNNAFKEVVSKINIVSFFKEHVYYIGFLFFYFSIYLILKSLGISDFSYFILCLNVIIGILFFTSHKAELFRDFVKMNTILFSLYYIFLYLFSFILGGADLIVLDSINTLFIFCFFLITFYSDSKILKKPGADSPLVLYFFLYSFIVFSYYVKQILGIFDVNFSQIFIYIGLVFNIFIYYFLQKVTFFQDSKYLLRVMSILFLYISHIFGIYLLVKDFSYFSLETGIITGILLYGITFNYLIHKNFQNYVSLFFSFSTAVFLAYFFLVKYSIYSGGSILKGEIVLTFTLGFFAVTFSYLYKLKYIFDYYFLHICAYVVNCLGIIYYLLKGGFNLFDSGIILLLVSIFIFLSYFKLKTLKV